MAAVSDSAAVELGLKFKTLVPGKIVGVRFFKGLGNTGRHIGSLWAADGSILRSNVFRNEMAFGWQTMYFAVPLSVSADETYTVSYHAPRGRYAYTRDYFQSPKTNQFLAAPAGENGVYKYGRARSYPDSTYYSANYWVDVVFVPEDTTVDPVQITINPTQTALSPGQSQQFQASVTGSSNTAVNWSLSKAAGSISSSGLYTAPANIASADSVVITATSVADPSKNATATVTLMPVVSISLNPSSVNLQAGESRQFQASVTGSSNTAVNWSLSKAAGSISSSGLYTAPANIASADSVVVTATSVADPSKRATATVTLTPTTISISVSPGSVNLQAGESRQFQASVTGSSNTAVNWSLSKAAGSISSSGLYTAPANIASPDSVVVTATSVADPSKKATATVSLTPTTISISVSPGSTSLRADETQQFQASVTGASDTAVVWTLSKPTGTLSSTGHYRAPSVISASDSVTVTATSVADAGKKASASINLLPTVSSSQIRLPLEVMGVGGEVETATVELGSEASQGQRLRLRLHGLRYATQGSVRVNGGGWIALSDSTLTLTGPARDYGGIGGGFHTLDAWLPLPSGTLRQGSNDISFRFNGTDGRSSGFRVLALNIENAAGTPLLSSGLFVQDDPNQWQPPLSAGADIAEGERLWRNAALNLPGRGPVQAKCADCHAQDGRDLRYFNYSNYSIRQRARFHGLSAQQGDQIASYIRSLATPNPGRPWNPPYQPGPGLDAKPVEHWAAGAGIDAVLGADVETYNSLHADLYPATANLNIRETPIAMQMPDWNHWLPEVHPMDAWGSAFTNDGLNQYYYNLRSQLRPGDAAAYRQARETFKLWVVRWQEFTRPRSEGVSWDAERRRAVYSTALWKLVKLWELMQENELEGLGKSVFSHALAEDRTWYNAFPFFVSPNMQHMPAGPGLANGKQSVQIYLSFIWYHVQLILNSSNGEQYGNSPVDWQYVYGFIKDLSNNAHEQQAAMQTLWLIKALQISNHGRGPEQGVNGWMPHVNDISRLVHPSWRYIWQGVSPSLQATSTQALVQSWFNEVRKFTPQQYYQGGWASSSETPNRNAPDGRFVDRVWFLIPQFRHRGVSPALTSQIADWAKTLWPNANWNETKTASCSTANNSEVRCTSQN